jgi:hypothetical protein
VRIICGRVRWCRVVDGCGASKRNDRKSLAKVMKVIPYYVGKASSLVMSIFILVVLLSFGSSLPLAVHMEGGAIVHRIDLQVLQRIVIRALEVILTLSEHKKSGGLAMAVTHQRILSITEYCLTQMERLLVI